MLTRRYHLLMGQLLVRNVADDQIAELKAQAASERISLEQRMRNLIDQATRKKDLEAWFQEVSARSREQTRNSKLDSTAIIREDRDR